MLLPGKHAIAAGATEAARLSPAPPGKGLAKGR